MKYLITSVPKSGTYLTANIFKNLEIPDSGIHIQDHLYSRWIKGGWRQDGDNSDTGKKIWRATESIIDEVKDGEFLTGHIQRTTRMIEKFKGYKKVLLVRDITGVIESGIRYNHEKGINLLEFVNIESINKIKEWAEDEDCLVINFNDLINKNTDILDSLQIHLFGEIRFNSLEIIELSLKQESPTKSNLRRQQFNEGTSSSTF